MTHVQDTHASHPSLDARSATQPLVHDGRTRAAWVGSAGALIGFLLATVGFLMNFFWPIIIVGFVIVLGSAAAGLILRNLGHGAKEA